MNYGDARLPERFWNKVIPEPTSGCWLWLGSASKRDNGIGQIRWLGRTYSVHALAWRSAGGEPSDAVLHKCGVGCCVNPSHLVAGALGDTAKRKWAGYHPTHCKHGHELADDNLYRMRLPDGRLRRVCKRCHRDRIAMRSAEHFAAALRRLRSPARRRQLIARRATGKRAWRTRIARYGQSGMS